MYRSSSSAVSSEGFSKPGTNSRREGKNFTSFVFIAVFQFSEMPFRNEQYTSSKESCIKKV